MPLSKTGKKVERKMEHEYGLEKGKRIFFAAARKHQKWMKGCR